jgi:hypothetical protein
MPMIRIVRFHIVITNFVYKNAIQADAP